MRLENLNMYDIRPEFFEGVDLVQFCKNTGVKESAIYSCLRAQNFPSQGGALYASIWAIKKVSYPSFCKQFKKHKSNIAQVKKTHLTKNGIEEKFRISLTRVNEIIKNLPSISFGANVYYDVTTEYFLNLELGPKVKRENHKVAEDPLRHIVKPNPKKIRISEYAKSMGQSYQNIAAKLGRGTLKGGRDDLGLFVFCKEDGVAIKKKKRPCPIEEVTLFFVIVNFILIVYGTFFK
tara:strand:- start:440 stop:1144 length:705 start_codon:yes stop_codon:yes gene_type:complete